MSLSTFLLQPLSIVQVSMLVLSMISINNWFNYVKVRCNTRYRCCHDIVFTARGFNIGVLEFLVSSRDKHTPTSNRLSASGFTVPCFITFLLFSCTRNFPLSIILKIVGREVSGI
jgi:hypothetical protein